MSEETEKDPNATQQNVTSKALLDGPGIPEYYAETSGIWVGSSDVTLYFGRKYNMQPMEYPGATVAKVVMSHDHFFGAMKLFVSRLLVLHKVYDGVPPSLNRISQEDMEKLWTAANNGDIFTMFNQSGNEDANNSNK